MVSAIRTCHCLSLCAEILMRPSCATGWFYHKSHCYGYFRKLRNWSDAEVRAVGHARTGPSKARGCLGVSSYSEPRVLAWPLRSHRAGEMEGRGLCVQLIPFFKHWWSTGSLPRPHVGCKDIRTTKKQPLPPEFTVTKEDRTRYIRGGRGAEE